MARTKQNPHKSKVKKSKENANNTPLGESRLPQDQPDQNVNSKQHSAKEITKDGKDHLAALAEAQLDGTAEPPKQQQQSKKKKKNAPDRLQPEWMFPPDESNPVLNPKQKPVEEIIKDKEEWDAAIKYLKHRAHTAPVKTAPPKQLLTLVGAFLTAYGFNNTVRIYQLQCSSRNRLDGWDSVLGEKLPKDFPDLVKIYKDWLKTYEEKQKMDETSSSDTDDSVATKQRKKTSKDRKAIEAANAKVDQTSSSESSSDNDSDVEMEDAPTTTKPASKPKPTKRSSSSSSSSSSSDSDADDENETAGLGAPTRKPTVTALINNLKRKKSATTSSSSTSSSSEDEPAVKKAKKTDPKPTVTAKAAKPTPKQPSPKPLAEKDSSSESSDSSSSESEKDTVPAITGSKEPALPAKKSSLSSDASSSSSSSDSDSIHDYTVPKPKKAQPTVSKPSSDSSVTLVAMPTIPAPAEIPLPASSPLSSSSSSTSSSSSSSASDSPTTKPTSKTTKPPKRKPSTSPIANETPPSSKKHQEQKPKNPSFTRIPATVAVDERFASNKYQPYDYAERAHQDLSVTKGKGFTKEKNKKKRGSYRGGAIDVSGGKGVKFEE